MPDENKDQGTPENLLGLKEFEHQEMLKAAAEINPRAPQEILSIMTATTAAENILVGSSPLPGAVSHPNWPLAHVAGKSLEEINQVRRERNGKPSLFPLSVGNDLLLIYFKYLDLTEEDLHDSQPRRTFRVVRVTNLSGAMIDVPGDLDKLINKKISAGVEKERQALTSRLQGKISTDSS